MGDTIPIGLMMMKVPMGQAIMPIDADTGRRLDGVVSVTTEQVVDDITRAHITLIVAGLFDSTGKRVGDET